jgi:DNA-binding transcriptional regulator YhcF (GntR family)
MRPPIIALEESQPQPLFLQVARSIANDIRRGRLRRGAPLPGSRTLAKSLGVHRNTVLAAFAELTQEGWIVTRPARGTFVADALPDVTPRRFGLVSRPRKHVELPLAEPWPAEPYEPLPEGCCRSSVDGRTCGFFPFPPSQARTGVRSGSHRAPSATEASGDIRACAQRSRRC